MIPDSSMHVSVVCRAAFFNNTSHYRCGVGLDTWMFPVYKEVYDLVKAPLVFINSWDFQWPENIKSMQKLVKESDESGVCRLCVCVSG